MKKLILVLVLICSTLLNSQIPQTISWQGILQDANGNNLNGSYNLTVKLYDAVSNGSQLWTESHNSVNISNGFLSIILGSQTEFNLPFNKQYWLEVSINNGTPLPRIPLTSVPYALNTRDYTEVYDDGTKEVYTTEYYIINNTFNDIFIRFDKNGKQRKKIEKKERLGEGEREFEEIVDIYDEDGGLLTRAFEWENEDELGIEYQKRMEWHDEQQKYFEESWSKFVDFLGVQAKIQEQNRKKFFDVLSGSIKYQESNDDIYDETGYDFSKTKEWFDDEQKKYFEESWDKFINFLGEQVKVQEQNIKKFSDVLSGSIKYQESNESTYDNSGYLSLKRQEEYDDSGIMRTVKTESEKLNNTEKYNEEKTTTYDELGNNQTEISSKDDYQTGTSSKTTSNETTDESLVTEQSPSGFRWTDVAQNSSLWVTHPPEIDNSSWNFGLESSYFNDPFFSLSNDQYGGYVSFGGESFGILSEYGFAAHDFDIYGNASISGDLNVWGNKNFKINHPTDPDKHLYHSCVESNEVLNIYSGNITTDANGNAIVSLPEYFEAINTNYRYQLTVIGDFAQAIIAKEIKNAKFDIKTDKPNIKVSWQVTANRNDEYMQKNPFRDVRSKSEDNKLRQTNLMRSKISN